MHVQVGEVILPFDALQEVEYTPKVGEEGFVARAGEDLDAVAYGVDGLVRHLAVALWVGFRSHVSRCGLQTSGDDRTSAVRFVVVVSFEHRHGVELFLVQVRVVQRSDWTGVVQEGIAVVDDPISASVPTAEAELETEIVPGVAVVVDVDLVEDIVAEEVEIGTRRRYLQRYVVRDE